MAATLVILVLSALVSRTLAAFGVTTVGNALRVDTDAGLVFDINRWA
jgi:hypothetical protein